MSTSRFSGAARVAALAGIVAGAALGFGISAASGGSSLNGLAGPPATTGALEPKPTGKSSWIVVNSNGVKARSFPATTTSTRLGTGLYEVTLVREVANCAYIGTVGEPVFGGEPGDATLTVAGRTGTTKSIFVETHDSTGAKTDEPFHLDVIC